MKGSQPSESRGILLVEDNDADIRLVKEGIKETRIKHQLFVVKDGVMALQFLEKKAPYPEAPTPGLILLDLNLPRKDGREVLKTVKSIPRIQTVPVIVFSSSDHQQDIMDTYRLQANCYICKPLSFDQFVDTFQSIENFWFNLVKLPLVD